MDIFERIETSKKMHSLNNRLLGEVVGDSEAAFGQIMRRKKMPSSKEKILTTYLDKLDNGENQIKNPSKNIEGIILKENDSLIKENEFLRETIKDLLKILGNKQ